MKREIVALIYGGDSSESEISVKSGKHIVEHIDRDRYEVYEVMISGKEWRVLLDDGRAIDIDKSDFSFVLPESSCRRVNFDKALIMIHGTPGENGLLQAYLEMVGVPFTSCSAVVSAITFDKYACKCYIRDTGIKLPRECFLRKGSAYSTTDIVERLGLPLFVKPNNGGSSFGVTKVKVKEELEKAIEMAFTEDESVLVEEFIEGREVTNGVYKNGDDFVRLPVTEIISDNEFFDYDAKYLGASKEICPANISDELSGKIVATSQGLYEYLGCSGVVRFDYILKGEEIYFLEVNTVPGMTEMSLVPQQIRSAGMSIKEFLTQLLKAD